MSGMFDSKTDKNVRKQAQTQKEMQERKKRRNITIVICVTFALLLAAALVVNSTFIRRAVPIVTIDGRDFTTAEFEFFFRSEYMEYMEFANQFQGLGMAPDTNRPLASQYFNEETRETWADFFIRSTMDRMVEAVRLYNAAIDSGFELTQESRDLIENEMMTRQMQAAMQGFPNTNAFLQRLFGFSINEDIFRNVLEFVLTAETYSIHMLNSFEYSDSELADFYSENSDSLDVFTYRVLTITPEVLSAEDFDDDTEFEEATAQALVDAQNQAQEIAAGITDEDSFLAAAEEYNEMFANPNMTLRNAMGERLEDDLSDWLLNSSRQDGDVTSINTETGATVVFFVSRNDNFYRTVSMNQILISRESIDSTTFPLGEEDPDYLEAVEQAKQEATDRANDLYELFVSGDTSKEGLIALMEEHSDDTTADGFYENIAKFRYQGSTFSSMQLVAEIEEWLFDPSREVGDFELIETEAFGYHLVMFSGFGDYFSKQIADDRMRVEAHSSWHDSLEVGEPQKHLAFILFTA